jgi:SsrA-binding protein
MAKPAGAIVKNDGVARLRSRSAEAGLVLVGSEVKSCAGKWMCPMLRGRRARRGVAEADVRRAFEQASAFPHEPRRARKLLLHAREVQELHRALARDGYAIVPLRLYFKRGRTKVEPAIAKGRKKYDKRPDIAKQTAESQDRAETRPGSR